MDTMPSYLFHESNAVWSQYAADRGRTCVRPEEKLQDLCSATKEDFVGLKSVVLKSTAMGAIVNPRLKDADAIDFFRSALCTQQYKLNYLTRSDLAAHLDVVRFLMKDADTTISALATEIRSRIEAANPDATAKSVRYLLEKGSAAVKLILLERQDVVTDPEQFGALLVDADETVRACAAEIRCDQILSSGNQDAVDLVYVVGCGTTEQKLQVLRMERQLRDHPEIVAAAERAEDLFVRDFLAHDPTAIDVAAALAAPSVLEATT